MNLLDFKTSEQDRKYKLTCSYFILLLESMLFLPPLSKMTKPMKKILEYTSQQWGQTKDNPLSCLQKSAVGRYKVKARKDKAVIQTPCSNPSKPPIILFGILLG